MDHAMELAISLATSIFVYVFYALAFKNHVRISHFVAAAALSALLMWIFGFLR